MSYELTENESVLVESKDESNTEKRSNDIFIKSSEVVEEEDIILEVRSTSLKNDEVQFEETQFRVPSRGSYPFEALGNKKNYTLTKRDPEELFEGNWKGLKSLLWHWINILLIFLLLVPFSYFFKWGPIADFVISALGMLPLAHLIASVAEDLALHTGDVWGAIINASFGNGVELIVSIEALLKGKTLLVQYSLIGSIFSNLLFVLGCALVAGGNSSKFELDGVSANVILLIIGSLFIVVPQICDSKLNHLAISRASALILLCSYFQLLFWLYQNSKRDNAAKIPDEIEQYKLKPWCSALCLVILTAITTGVGEILVNSIEKGSEEMGFTYGFTMLVVLPFLGNAVEHYAAIVFAYKGKMDLAINTCVGSSTQICLLIMPFIVLLGWCLDIPMHMGLAQEKFVSLMLCLSTIVTFAIISDGVVHWLEGSMLLTLYLLFAVILCYGEGG